MDYQAANINGSVQHRIRMPHPHDVLSGRGGGINSHVGNITFRQWVAERKNDYNLAPSKAEKARVAQEVIDLVTSQHPSGRFLQKDPSSSFWLELDDDRRMAKTAQALREGAPQIRAAHRDELEENRLIGRRREKSSVPTRHTNAPAFPESFQLPSTPQQALQPVVPQDLDWLQQRAMTELQANVESAKRQSLLPTTSGTQGSVTTSVTNDSDEEWRPPQKRVRMDYRGQTVTPQEASPTLAASVQNKSLSWPPALELDAIPSSPRKHSQNLNRAHSLALSDVSIAGDWASEDFVNPFASDSDLEKRLHSHSHSSDSRPGRMFSNESLPIRTHSSESMPAPRPGILQETSSTSNGDMGGIGALMKNAGRTPSMSTSSSSGGGSSNSQVPRRHWSRSSFGSLSNFELDPSISGSKGSDNSIWGLGPDATPVSP